MKGSLTVEAAYLFPICFLIIGIVCSLGIFQYNCAVLKMTGYECILKTLEEESAEKDLQVHLMERAQIFAEERTVGVKSLITEVKITKSNAAVTYQCVQKFLNVPIEVTVSCERIAPEQTIWRSKMVMEKAKWGND